ncbi:hypothetical protein ACFU8W_36020 [Streptomyces sp. NPDC057565]|uniref:hypothetical protein n=1 Tax=Streptomyces sp. NPDC057565 TaxID=3346169 RepID=UPI0036B65D0C
MIRTVRVIDDAACLARTAFHAGMRRGLAPAEALATCADAWDEPPPLVYFGSGW